MDKDASLPFQVGQLAESKSFIEGFRGAWFRCRIKKISKRRGDIGYYLEYIDFPDEKISWLKLYQRPQASVYKSKSNGTNIKEELMVRPAFPNIHLECELPDISTISGTTVVVNDVWKVGDLVDWWTDGCYWSGTITQLLDEEKVEIQLLQPPLGEGHVYEVLCKDIRPTLNWSPDVGWTVPAPKVPENFCPCARLIIPANQGLSDSRVHVADEGKEEDVQAEAASSVEANGALSSWISHSSSLPEKSENMVNKLPEQLSSLTSPQDNTRALETKNNLDVVNVRRTDCSDDVSRLKNEDSSMCTAGSKEGDHQASDSGSLKRIRVSGSSSLNTLRPGSLEAAVIGLEELVNKVKWLRGIVDFGDPNALYPPWKFIERGTSAEQE